MQKSVAFLLRYNAPIRYRLQIAANKLRRNIERSQGAIGIYDTYALFNMYVEFGPNKMLIQMPDDFTQEFLPYFEELVKDHRQALEILNDPNVRVIISLMKMEASPRKDEAQVPWIHFHCILAHKDYLPGQESPRCLLLYVTRTDDNVHVQPGSAWGLDLYTTENSDHGRPVIENIARSPAGVRFLWPWQQKKTGGEVDIK